MMAAADMIYSFDVCACDDGPKKYFKRGTFSNSCNDHEYVPDILEITITNTCQTFPHVLLLLFFKSMMRHCSRGQFSIVIMALPPTR